MELKEIQSLPIAPAVGIPFATSWSEDNKISVITEKGLFIVDGARRSLRSASTMLVLWLLILVPLASAGDITNIVFGNVVNVKPAAFGDFNSDELTDLFVLKDDNGMMTLEVMLASDQEPLLKPGGDNYKCTFPNKIIVTSVVPGNFDGDAHMDVMVTLLNKTRVDRHVQQIHILWGGGKFLNCSGISTPVYEMKGQPVAIDYNHDMIVDLYGEDKDGNRTCIVFNKDRNEEPGRKNVSQGESPLRVPHSHAYLDLNGDFAADLLLSTEKGFELHLSENDQFVCNGTIKLPDELTVKDKGQEMIGQSIFVDLELTGKLYHLLPVCFDKFKECGACENSTIYAYIDGKWHNLNPDFKGNTNQIWGFYRCQHKTDTMDAIPTVTLRAGDFNMDGYPDLLATLGYKQSDPQVFLLENVAKSSGSLSRSYVLRWEALSPMNNKTGMAAFYDLYQDGVLDVILYGHNKAQAFRNTLDYDANFVKVMVLTGTERGGNLPGPRISYRTTTQDGTHRAAVTGQMPQSAHFALGLPYTIFGLGRTPNFVDTLTVGVANKYRDWTQIIPNSQMVVIPSPIEHPGKWRAQLFITPSKMILLSVAALLGTCVLITAIIGVLYWKERREDRIEKLQEAHRFHFDAILIIGGLSLEVFPDPVGMQPCLKLHRSWVEPIDYLPTAYTNINCDNLIWKLNQKEVYQMVLNTYLAPNLSNTKSVAPYIVQLAWSPAGMWFHSRCLLASVTNYGCVVIQASGGKHWQLLVNISSLWIEKCTPEWDSCESSLPKEQFEILQTRSNKAKATAIAWSSLLGDREYCFLIVGVQDGTLLFWRLNSIKSARNNDLEPKLLLQLKTEQYHITTIHWMTKDDNSGLLFVGDVKGVIKMYSVKWQETELSCSLLTELWPHSDRIQVIKLCTLLSHNSEVTVIAVKGSFVIVISLDSNYCILQTKPHHVGNLGINGMIMLDSSSLLVLTLSGCFSHINISRTGKELDMKVQTLNTIIVPKSAYYGICSSANRAIFCLVTSLNTVFDHLIQREPAQITFFKLCGLHDPYHALLSNPSQTLTRHWDYLEVIRLQGPPFPDVEKEDIEQLNCYHLKIRMWLCRFAMMLEDPEEEAEKRNKVRRLLKKAEHLVLIQYIYKRVKKLTEQKSLSNEDKQSLALISSWIKKIEPEFKTPDLNAVLKCITEIPDLPEQEFCAICQKDIL
ncbi:hypothetical protein L9F63_008510 [Diploptera punctata]|uniref:Uncharacterized protein n=1 Tax=Diploptera punctata TaxID=6984 RepID=A0AAD7Z5E3_DIPPU|nr:hypothetical protein L9F63_008510 [Diploptera punctata]